MSSTLVDAVTHDHRELESYYNEVMSSMDADHQQRFANQFTWELARHSVAEELVVYPAMEKYLGAKGKQMTDKDREEHHSAKEKLKVFQNLSPSDAKFASTLKELMAELSEHIKGEEEDDLPALQAALKAKGEEGEKEGEQLAASFERTKLFVPTRSHPSAGENPPFESVMGLLTAPFDHISDLFRKFPNENTTTSTATK